MLSDSTPGPRTDTFWLTCLSLAVGLTMWFWLDLWLGGGLIGGDVYTYYFPQKAFLADALSTGQSPWWNPLVGHGYPFVGESQAGVYYPPTRMLYRLFDLNMAYNLNHLFHYVFAFVACMLLSRELGLSLPGSLLASLVFVYGWFPPRCCLEWAILTGAYLPCNLWLLTRMLRHRDRWSGWLIAPSLALQLLAGHFHLAFITLLAMAGWTAFHLIWPVKAENSGAEKSESNSERSDNTQEATTNKRRSRFTLTSQVAGVLVLGFFMAGIQLLPTWQLKQQSQRETSQSEDFNPAYGHLPPKYLSQVAVPWMWYSSAGELAGNLNQPSFLAIDAATNPVEAHLYFGLLPLLLILLAVIPVGRGKTETDRSLRLLGILGLFGLLYAFGWLLPILGEVPGFSFFRGPARYTLLTTLAAAFLAGRGWDLFHTRLPKRLAPLLFAVIFGLTVLDFSWVSRRITYAFMVPETPITLRDKSEVARRLKAESEPARLFAPGQNLVTITGIAATPVYLGIGPAEYFDPELTYPPDESGAPFGASFTDAQIDWLQRAGVTHVLGFAPPPGSRSELEPVWQGIDPFLNAAWGRREPLFLSRLSGSRGRAAWANSPEETADSIRWKDYSATSIDLEVEASSPQTLVLTDLQHPGWKVTVDGKPADSETIDGMYRAVEVPSGSHQVRWEYSPWALRAGFWLSVAGFTIWTAGICLSAKRSSLSTNYSQK